MRSMRVVYCLQPATDNRYQPSLNVVRRRSFCFVCKQYNMMITGEPFPLGVICNIYCPWCALSAMMAPSRLRLLCVCCGFWTSRYEADGRKVPTCCFTSSWLTGCLLGCAAQEPCLWSGGLCIMEQSVSIAQTHAHRHTQTEPISLTGSTGHIQPRRTPLSLVCHLKWSAYCSVVRGCVFVLVLACLQH